MTGLSDFGGDEYHEPLRVLLDSFEPSAGLTGVGNTMERSFVRGALAAGCCREKASPTTRRTPTSPIERPIFVTGIQRSGTTAVQRLLHADPAAQGLEMWLTQVPQPRPPRETWDDDPVYAMLKQGFEQHHAENPEYAGIHYMTADTGRGVLAAAAAERTSRRLRVAGPRAEVLRVAGARPTGPTPTSAPANLQLIGLQRPGQAVGARRTPATWSRSTPDDGLPGRAGRADAPRPGVSRRVGLLTVGRGDERLVDGLQRRRHRADPARHALARGARRSRTPGRATRPGSSSTSQYDDFVADPVATTRGIYEAFDLPWTADVAARVDVLDRESRTGPRTPQHRYTLDDYGLTEPRVRAAFPPPVVEERLVSVRASASRHHRDVRRSPSPRAGGFEALG